MLCWSSSWMIMFKTPLKKRQNIRKYIKWDGQGKILDSVHPEAIEQQLSVVNSVSKIFCVLINLKQVYRLAEIQTES